MGIVNKFIVFVVLGIPVFNTTHAQVVNVGIKYEERTMFQAGINVPLIFDNTRPFDISYGVDYTSPNARVPSGLQAQTTALYFIIDDEKLFLLALGLNAGYLFDFNKQFNNQFRFTPHLYTEFFLFNCKVGYDYMMPFNRGYPAVSIGIGGGYLFRHFKIGL